MSGTLNWPFDSEFAFSDSQPKTDEGSTFFDEAEFAKLLQGELSPRSVPKPILTSAPSSRDKPLHPPILYNPPSNDVDPSDPFNFDLPLPFNVPFDPSLPSGLPPAPTGVISEPQTPFLTQLSTPSLPTMSQIPSLVASPAPSFATAPQTPATVADDLDDMDLEDIEDGEEVEEATLNITFEHESATKVQDTTGKALQHLTYKTLEGDDNVRVYGSCPPPPLPNSSEDTPEAVYERLEREQFNAKLSTHLWQSYPHDHHVVFTGCRHEDRFFAFVESHLKMCMCDRISRVFMDIEILDRERANMEGEVGAWKVFNAGLEKEMIDGSCPACEKKDSKNKKLAAKKSAKKKGGGSVIDGRVGKESGSNGSGEKRVSGESTGGLLKHKRPYKRRNREGEMADSITVRQYNRVKRR